MIPYVTTRVKVVYKQRDPSATKRLSRLHYTFKSLNTKDNVYFKPIDVVVLGVILSSTNIKEYIRLTEGSTLLLTDNISSTFTKKQKILRLIKYIDHEFVEGKCIKLRVTK